MSVDSLSGLALKMRHLAGEWRDVRKLSRGIEDVVEYIRNISWLRGHLYVPQNVFVDAIDYLRHESCLILQAVAEAGALPASIQQEANRHIAIDWRFKGFICDHFVGYFTPKQVGICDEPDQTMPEYFVCCTPGYVAIEWPELFKPILGPEIEINTSLDDIKDLGAPFCAKHIFVICGYYATACDLLAEWIENHADDDRGDQPGEQGDQGDQGDQNVDPFPNDGLDKDGKAFEWGGRRFDQLTGGMMRVLELLHDERKKGHPNVPVTLIRRLAKVSTTSGMKSQIFKLNREGWPPIHPVIEIVIDNGDATYRLIDPDKVPAKVPDGS